MSAENDRCTRFEELVSALLDGELDAAGYTEAVDHLARCAACRAFYREARALDGLADALEPAAAAPAAEAPEAPAPPERIWRAVEEATAPPRRRAAGGWLLRAAALAILAVGLLFLWPGDDPAGPRALPAAIEVELGSRSGEMDDARFIEMARELMESDWRYQRAMQEVMEEVLRTQPATEGGGEAEERDDGGEEARGLA